EDEEGEEEGLTHGAGRRAPPRTRAAGGSCSRGGGGTGGGRGGLTRRPPPDPTPAMLRRLFARRPTPVSLEDARARAARGAAFLDGTDPGWHGRVSPGALTLSDGQACVLGQLHGEYRLGLFRAGVFDGSSARFSFVSPTDLGFHARRELDEAAAALDYAYLTRAWREEVE